MTISGLDAENTVCGSILIDSRCLAEILDVLAENDFCLESNRAIFHAAVELNRRGEVIDPVTILREAGGAVSQDYLMQLMEVTPTAANAGIYALETRRASMTRSLRALGETIARETGPACEPGRLIGDLQRALEQIEAQDTARELASSADAILAFYHHRGRIDSGAAGVVPTGFRPLDDLLGSGLLNNGLYILAARPGMGKTTFALAAADYAAASGPVLFVSLEMDLEQIAAKRIGREAGISSSALLMGKLSEEENRRAAEHSARLAKLPVYINRKPWATVDDIAVMARKVKDLRLLVIDYFGLIKPSQPGSRYEYTTEISGQLKALARMLHVPVLCLAQLNRQNQQRQDKRPMLSDLRDTGALEQDADGVIFLHRTDYYETAGTDAVGPWEPVPMEIILAKNRHAGTGMCEASFFRAVGRIWAAQSSRRGTEA